jgi:hypothetical protein
MKIIALLKFALLAPLLGACASLSVDPTIHGKLPALMPVPSACGSATGDDRQLCDGLAQTRRMAESYLGTARLLDNEHRVFSATQLTSAGAIAGFSLFGAHADNTSAAGLAGGIATTLEGGLHPAERARIYIRAMNATQCVAMYAAPFLDDSTTLNARLDRAAWYRSAADALPLLADYAASKIAIPAGEGRLTAVLMLNAGRALEDAEDRLNATAETLLRDAGAQQTAHERVNDALAGIRKYVEDALARQVPNLGDIAGKLRAPPKPAQPAAGGAGARTSFMASLNNTNRMAIAGLTDDSMAILAPLQTQRRVTMAGFNSLGSLVEAAANQRAPAAPAEGPGEGEFAAIARCVPTFTPPPETPPAPGQPAR